MENDGLTFETAINAPSVEFEYDWIRENYPGARVSSQALTEFEGNNYDRLTILTVGGEEMDIYFDISSFFGFF